MTHKNPFDGNSSYAQFARITYKRLMSRLWVTYADVMAEHQQLGSAQDLRHPVSKCVGYQDLKKAFADITDLIVKKLGGGSLEKATADDDKRQTKYRYIGSDDDPLLDLRNVKVIDDLKKYWQFCQNSEGFFPMPWLDYFFKGSRDLLDIKTKRSTGEHILSTDMDRQLTNIELLPLLYEAILNKQVLEIDYKSFKEQDREQCTLIFSPHYLREFNGRWFLLGYAEGLKPYRGYNVAIDRIVNRPREIDNGQYVAAPAHFYDNYFNDIIGVTHDWEFPVKEEVLIRVHTYYMFKLVETKQFHHSQTVVKPFGKHDDGVYGVFSLKIRVNNEFIGRILQMGDALEIVSPEKVRAKFRERIINMEKRYKENASEDVR